MGLTLKMLALYILLVGGSLFACHVLSAGGTNQLGVGDTSGDIQRVTLYRDQALVTRQIELPGGNTRREITISDLPELMVSGSVYAEAVEPATIEAISVSPAPSGSHTSPEIAAIDSKTTELSRQRQELRSHLRVVKENEKLLSQLVAFSAKSGSADLNRGILNVESLTELTLFSMQQRAKLAAEKHELETKETAIESEIDRLIEQRNRLSISSGKRNYHARIFVNAPADEVAMIRLSYLVRGCGWNPQYIIRGQSGRDAIRLQYSAVVNQMTGENWDRVELTLSTATPAASAARPILTPLRISSAPVPQPDDEDETFTTASNILNDGQKMTRLTNLLRENRQRAEADSSRLGGDSEGRDLQLNVFAGQLQQLELTARSKSLRSLAIDASDDLASQTYAVVQRVSLDSRRQQQLIQVLETDLEGEQYHVATPLLSSFAYRQARVTNTQPVGLLTGPASVYLDGRFVGRIEIPATASGQKLTIGFGIDSQIRTRRELVEKTDNLKGGNRQINLEFRLVISNFKHEPAVVRLVDRIPLTTESQALSIGLESSVHPLSDDPLYCRILKPLGIVRWDLNVPAQKIGAEAMDVHYRYSLEFDRSRLPTTQHSLDEIVADYEESVGRGRGGGGFGGGGVFFD